MNDTLADWPLRLRLHRGRNTHAARPGTGSAEGETFTPCGYMAGGSDHRLPDTHQVTCRACLKRMGVGA